MPANRAFIWAEPTDAWRHALRGDRGQEVMMMRAQAAKALGGNNQFFGVIGTPSWEFVGEVAAVSMVSGILSSILQQQAVNLINTANSKSEELAGSGEFYEASSITNLHIPHPQAWYAIVDTLKRVHNGDEFVNIRSDVGMVSVRWSDVVAYHPNAASTGRAEKRRIGGRVPSRIDAWADVVGKERYGASEYRQLSNGEFEIDTPEGPRRFASADAAKEAIRRMEQSG